MPGNETCAYCGKQIAQAKKDGAWDADGKYGCTNSPSHLHTPHPYEGGEKE